MILFICIQYTKDYNNIQYNLLSNGVIDLNSNKFNYLKLIFNCG